MSTTMTRFSALARPSLASAPLSARRAVTNNRMTSMRRIRMSDGPSDSETKTTTPVESETMATPPAPTPTPTPTPVAPARRSWTDVMAFADQVRFYNV